ncbi:MAG: acylphosphatase [Planctomycetes bacterium]|nr:acylphosphatase [Planctomycetota bacterium]
MSNEPPDSPALRRVRLRISGRVQGVAYRWSALDKARDLHLDGWVRNLPGGDVEALLQGEPGGVSEMIDWCWKGPSMARVSSVDVEEEEPRAGEPSGFRIVH